MFRSTPLFLLAASVALQAQSPTGPALESSGDLPFQVDAAALGAAFNIWNGSELPTSCVAVGQSGEDLIGAIQSDVYSTTDRSVITKAESLSLDARIGIGPFSSRVGLKRRLWEGSSRDRETFFLSVEYVASRRTARDVDLTEQAAALAASDPREFERVCGQGFVRSVRLGGEAVGAWSFAKSALVTGTGQDLRFSLGGPLVDIEGAVSRFQELQSVTSESSFSGMQLGALGQAARIANGSFLAAADSLPIYATNNPAILSVVVSPYHRLKSWPAHVAGGTYSLNSAVDSLHEQIAQFRQLQDDAADVLQNEDSYIMGWGTTRQKVGAVFDSATARLQSLMERRSECAETGRCRPLRGLHEATDYHFRHQLPLAKRSFPEDTDLEASWPMIEGLEVRLADTSEGNERRELESNLRSQRSLVATLAPQYDHFLRNAIIKEAIDLPRIRRCRARVSGCISDEQAEGFRRDVHVARPDHDARVLGPNRDAP